MDKRLTTQKFSDEQEEKAFEAWKSFDERITLLEDQVDSDYYYKIHDKSSLAEDNKRSQPFEVAHIIGSSLVTSIDYISTMRDLVCRSGTLHIFAPQALARSAIENAAVGLWVLTPSIGNERVERAFNWWFQNSVDHHHAREEYRNTDHEKFKQRLRKLAKDQELDPDSATKTLSITNILTELSKNSTEFKNLKFAWQLASGFTHGRPWAIQGALARTSIEENEEVVTIRIENSITLTAFLAGEAIGTVESLNNLRITRSS